MATHRFFIVIALLGAAVACATGSKSQPGDKGELTFLVDEQSTARDRALAAGVDLTLLQKDGSQRSLGSTGTLGGAEVKESEIAGQWAILFSKEGYGTTVWWIPPSLTGISERSVGILRPSAPAQLFSDTASEEGFAVRGFLERQRREGSTNSLTCSVRGLGLEGPEHRSVLLLQEGARVWMLDGAGKIHELGKTDLHGKIQLSKALLNTGFILGASAPEFYFDGGWIIDPAELAQHDEINFALAQFFVR